jgi:hypothetical protein
MRIAGLNSQIKHKFKFKFQKGKGYEKLSNRRFTTLF